MADSNTKRLFYNSVNFGDNSKASSQSRDKDFKESIKEEESDQSGEWKIETHIHYRYFSGLQHRQHPARGGSEAPGQTTICSASTR